MTSLDTFFDQLRGALRGEATAGEVCAALGESPTGLEALRWQLRLHQSHQLRTLTAFYAPWAARVGEAWPELVATFLRAHPPSSWSLPHIAEPMPAWAGARDDPEAWLAEAVMDWVWVRWEVRHAWGGRRHAVRAWTCDLPAWLKLLRADPRVEAPSARPTAVLLVRVDGVVRTHRLSAAQLRVVVDWEQGLPVDPEALRPLNLEST